MPNERIRPPGWLKPMNKVLMAMLRLGLPISRHEAPVVLTAPGRKPGKPRSTPVSPMDVDGKRTSSLEVPRGGLGGQRACRRCSSRWRARADAPNGVRLSELAPEHVRPGVALVPGSKCLRASGSCGGSAWSPTACPTRRRRWRAACRYSASTRSRSVAAMSNSERIKPPWWLKYVNKVMIGLAQARRRLRRQGTGCVDGRRPQVGQAALDARHPDDRRREAIRGRRLAGWLIGAANVCAPPARRLSTSVGAPSTSGMVEIPVDDARPLLRAFPVEVPTGVGFMKNAGRVTGPNPDEFEALAGRCPVFRLKAKSA